MRRLLILLIAAGAAAAAARFARARSQPAPAAAPPPPPPPPATPAPGREPEPVSEPKREPEPEPEPAPLEVSAVSPATETVKEADVPELAETPPDEEVEREVEAQIESSPVAEAADVNVEVQDGIAQLEGSVPDEQTAMLIGDEAAHVDGVQGLDNRLRPTGETADEAVTEEEEARER